MTAETWIAAVQRKMSLAKLTPHPRNYQEHPQDQIEHLKASLTEHGFYRPVVVAEDDVILAGHGICEAARQLGYTRIPVWKLPIRSDSPAALRVLAGDNELNNLAEVDDRLLTEILRSLIADGEPLLGTGFDDEQLAMLTMVTRSRDEIGDLNEAAEWIGLPSWERDDAHWTLIITFDSDDERRSFAATSPITLRQSKEGARTWSARGGADIAKVNRKARRYE